MIRIRKHYGPIAACAAVMLTGAGGAMAGGAQGVSENALLDSELTRLEAITAHYQRIENAWAEGYDFSFGGCMENPPIGAMGHHWANSGYYLDGKAVLSEPEVMVYEPMPDGSRKLVAIEYVVAAHLWADPEPPRLFGRDFHLNDHETDWILHVWLYKNNPDGLFADWNPNVSCEYAD